MIVEYFNIVESFACDLKKYLIPLSSFYHIDDILHNDIQHKLIEFHVKSCVHNLKRHSIALSSFSFESSR